MLSEAEQNSLARAEPQAGLCRGLWGRAKAQDGRQLSLLWDREGGFHLQPAGLVPQPVRLVLHQELPDGNMVRQPKLKRDPCLRFSLDISASLLLSLSYHYLSCPRCFAMGSATHLSMASLLEMGLAWGNVGTVFLVPQGWGFCLDFFFI